MSRERTFSDYVANEARQAIHDVRQKLFEEAWFGRVVTAEPVMEVFRERDAERDRQPTFDDLWGRSRDGQEQPEPAKTRDEPEIER